MTNKNDLTVEEAIIELNRCKINGYAPTDWDRRCKAVELANMALRKQIPVKPIRKSVFITPTYFQCPTCKNEFSIEWETPYCGQCGQAFDLNGFSELGRDYTDRGKAIR